MLPNAHPNYFKNSSPTQNSNSNFVALSSDQMYNFVNRKITTLFRP